MLKTKNLSNLKSERSLYSPNVNSLMKICLGLIFFTIISTALVYGENETESNLVIHISENASSYNSAKYFDNSMLSSNPGKSIIVINDDTVSHSFVSGVSNNNNVGKINYEKFLLCEFTGDTATYGINTDKTDCDFTKDNRIIVGAISPGESVSISIDEVGTYRIIDPDYPWMEFVVYSFPESQLESERPINESKIVSVSPVTVSVETISVDVHDVSFNVEYSAIGMTVTKIESDTESMSLIFSVDVTDSTGKLNVEFDRIFFDSVYGGVDDSFFILADGDETIFREIQTNSQSRTLSIDVPSGTEELEVIGSAFYSFDVTETPVTETPVTETPVTETPVTETPVTETPVTETPVTETPVTETPVTETPVTETPVTETPSANECGPGTLLENDICVLDQRCGPGTILENDVCMLDYVPAKSSSSGNSKELIMGVVVAFVIAGIIGIIFALISKVNRNKN